MSASGCVVAGLGCASVTRGSGARVLVSDCSLFCDSWACAEEMLVGTIGSDVSESDIHVSLADDCGVIVLVTVKFCITVGNVHGMMKAGFEGVRESRQ